MRSTSSLSVLAVRRLSTPSMPSESTTSNLGLFLCGSSGAVVSAGVVVTLWDSMSVTWRSWPSAQRATHASMSGSSEPSMTQQPLSRTRT